MKVGELFVALGFDVDDKKLKDFNSGVQSTVVTLGKMAAVAAAALFAANKFASGSAQYAVQLQNFSDQTGVATEEVQRFYNVASRLNSEVTMENVIGSFTRLSEVIAEAKMGRGPLGVAAQLGIENLGALSEMQVIETLRRNFARNTEVWGRGDEQVVIDMMKQIGIGPEYIRTIKATDEEFTRLANNAILSEEKIARLAELAAKNKELSIQFQLLKDSMAAAVAPTLITFMENLLAVAGKIPTAIQKARGEFNALPEPLKLVTVGLVAAAAAAAALAAPFGPIIAGVGLMLAALNDLGRYLRGESSLTGSVIDGAGDLWDKLKGSISSELAKSPEEHRRDRERILRESSPAGRVGPQSMQNNNFYIQTDDARQAAMLTVDQLANLQNRENRRAQVDIGFNASGMFA